MELVGRVGKGRGQALRPIVEEPALEGKAKVVYRGEIRFNYPVEPTTLALLVKLADPEVPKPSRSRSTTCHVRG